MTRGAVIDDRALRGLRRRGLRSASRRRARPWSARACAACT